MQLNPIKPQGSNPTSDNYLSWNQSFLTTLKQTLTTIDANQWSSYQAFFTYKPSAQIDESDCFTIRNQASYQQRYLNLVSHQRQDLLDDKYYQHLISFSNLLPNSSCTLVIDKKQLIFKTLGRFQSQQILNHDFWLEISCNYQDPLDQRQINAISQNIKLIQTTIIDQNSGNVDRQYLKNLKNSRNLTKVQIKYDHFSQNHQVNYIFDDHNKNHFEPMIVKMPEVARLLQNQHLEKTNTKPAQLSL